MAENPITKPLVVKTFSKNDITSSTSYINGNMSVAWEGHTPICIVGWAMGKAALNLYTCYLSDNTCYFGMSRPDGTSLNNEFLRVYVLYQ